MVKDWPQLPSPLIVPMIDVRWKGGIGVEGGSFHPQKPMNKGNSGLSGGMEA
jgi:hypothetical protein